MKKLKAATIYRFFRRGSTVGDKYQTIFIDFFLINRARKIFHWIEAGKKWKRLRNGIWSVWFLVAGLIVYARRSRTKRLLSPAVGNPFGGWRGRANGENRSTRKIGWTTGTFEKSSLNGRQRKIITFRIFVNSNRNCVHNWLFFVPKSVHPFIR